ncbi:hypothetical protein GALMADRAFT_1180100 [Galerina marginata CBS 339.88]|uniref:Dipeptidyl-peptidase V n=1 Tax=Galerina marginata (strain CBS 339.88) TaxID=685588 RepID=A0A067TA88_GALM3|nr:hypothetical protein GALMADRAFT_1180100 [Galerina marginata CBS 339.88]
MRFPFTLLGLSAQIPLQFPTQSSTGRNVTQDKVFGFKEGPDHFSPKDLIQLGRPGVAVSNEAGDLAFVPYSKFSIEDKTNEKSVYIISLTSEVPGSPVPIPLGKGGETFWLSSRTIANVVQGGESSEVYLYDVSIPEFGQAKPSSNPGPYNSPVLVGTLPSKEAANFRYNAGTGDLVFSAPVYSDGNLSTVAQQDKEWEERGNSALVYDKTPIRYWDTWMEAKLPQLFSIQLTNQNGTWVLGDDIKSPLQGTKHHSPVENFDLSATHIVYTSVDPDHTDAWKQKQNIYIVPINGERKPVELTSGKQSNAGSPVFNTKGTKVAWLEQDERGYQADRTKLVIYDLEKQVRFRLTQHWDRSPEEIAFSKDDGFIYLTAGDVAKAKVFALPVPPTPLHSTTHIKNPKYAAPIAITHGKSAAGLQTLPGGKILFTQSSFTSPNDAFLASDLESFQSAVLAGLVPGSTQARIDRITNFSEQDLQEKDLAEGDEFWFQGARHKSVHGWTFRPKGWKPSDKKKWPVLLIIHGGPQSVFQDQWSTRWNPNVFAQQGYFVIMINPTGSTTFGQDFSDAIYADWGDKPFTDMILGWKHVLRSHPEIDPDRAVAAGASWGGYAMNWIQGHPEFGFGFKALVCHDGVFDTTYLGYATDDLSFFKQSWGGNPWDHKAKRISDKNSPASFVSKWSIPQLTIHGSKDYRVPETEGIAAFHALQQLGIPSRLVIFPDENHWTLGHGNSLKWHYEVFRWLDQYVGDN